MSGKVMHKWSFCQHCNLQCKQLSKVSQIVKFDKKNRISSNESQSRGHLSSCQTLVRTAKIFLTLFSSFIRLFSSASLSVWNKEHMHTMKMNTLIASILRSCMNIEIVKLTCLMWLESRKFHNKLWLYLTLSWSIYLLALKSPGWRGGDNLVHLYQVKLYR